MDTHYKDIPCKKCNKSVIDINKRSDTDYCSKCRDELDKLKQKEIIYKKREEEKKVKILKKVLNHEDLLDELAEEISNRKETSECDLSPNSALFPNNSGRMINRANKMYNFFDTPEKKKRINKK